MYWKNERRSFNAMSVSEIGDIYDKEEEEGVNS